MLSGDFQTHDLTTCTRAPVPILASYSFALTMPCYIDVPLALTRSQKLSHEDSLLKTIADSLARFLALSYRRRNRGGSMERHSGTKVQNRPDRANHISINPDSARIRFRRGQNRADHFFFVGARFGGGAVGFAVAPFSNAFFTDSSIANASFSLSRFEYAAKNSVCQSAVRS